MRGQDGQNETEQPDHSTILDDSITASTRIRFSVHRAEPYNLDELLFQKGQTALDILRALEVFIQTAETGSLSAAGRRLGMTSSAVSRQISALEHDVREALHARRGA